MSEIRVDQFSKADGSKKTNGDFVLGGCAKAWANLNGTGTISLRDSLNNSSVIDNGTGRYQFNLINTMTSTNFMVSQSQNVGDRDYPVGINIVTSTRFDAQCDQMAGSTNNNRSQLDHSYVGVAIHGDLA